MTDRIPAWMFWAMTAIGGVAIALALLLIRVSRRIPPAPVESDPVYDAAMVEEQETIDRIAALQERDAEEIEAVLDIEDADERSRELSRLMRARR